MLNMFGTAPAGAALVQVGSQQTCVTRNCCSWPGNTEPIESGPPATMSGSVRITLPGCPGLLPMIPKYPV